MSHGLKWISVGPDAGIAEVLRRQDEAISHGLPGGIALVTDPAGVLLGIVTDGDIRRGLLAHGGLDLTAGQVMTTDPICLEEGTSFNDILRRLPLELEARGRRSRRFLGKVVLVDAQRRPTRVLEYHQLWEQRVATHRHIVVVGLGYVGLTLALVLAEEGFFVTGVDSDTDRLDALRRGNAYVHEPGLPELLREVIGRNLFVTDVLPDGGDVFVIAVSTPVGKGVDDLSAPDLTALRSAADSVGRHLQRGGLVVLRSTVPIGSTRRVVLPILEEVSGLRAGIDFHLAFAPERTAEGKALEELRLIPQIIGGVNSDSVEATAALFREITPTIVRSESLEAAEFGKLINNSFRDLIFSFSNQLVQIGSIHNVDVVQAIQDANRGYIRDSVPLPSPGVGGPCLTKDPYILAAALPDGARPSLFEVGRGVNESMLDFVTSEVVHGLASVGRTSQNASVLICGLAFKGDPETADLRESSAVAIASRLKRAGVRLFGYDPVATADAIAAEGMIPASLPDGFSGMDAVLFLNNHSSFRKLDVFSMVRSLNQPGVVFDGWHLFRPHEVTSAGPCLYMGLGFRRSSVDAASPALTT